MKKSKSIFVNGIVKDSKNNMEKYLFSENERLNVIIDELEDGFKAATDELCEYATKIDKAIEYLKTFHFIDNIRVLDIKEYEKLIEILGDKENE